MSLHSKVSASSRRMSPDMKLRWFPVIDGQAVAAGGNIPFSGFDTRAEALTAAYQRLEMTVRSKDWYDEQEILEQECMASAPEFGVTLADAAKLMRKAKRVWVMFNIGPADRMGIFEIPKSVVAKEVKLYQGGKRRSGPANLTTPLTTARR